jgi:hypothetical protein
MTVVAIHAGLAPASVWMERADRFYASFRSQLPDIRTEEKIAETINQWSFQDRVAAKGIFGTDVCICSDRIF